LCRPGRPAPPATPPPRPVRAPLLAARLAARSRPRSDAGDVAHGGAVRPRPDRAGRRGVPAALGRTARRRAGGHGGAAGSAGRGEVDVRGRLAIRFADSFDRLDYLLAATAGWRQARDEADLPPDLLELVPRAWVQPFAAVRPLLVCVLEQISAAPRAWLRHFD